MLLRRERRRRRRRERRRDVDASHGVVVKTLQVGAVLGSETKCICHDDGGVSFKAAEEAVKDFGLREGKRKTSVKSVRSKAIASCRVLAWLGLRFPYRNLLDNNSTRGAELAEIMSQH